jgi:MFS transporter, PPP family, 3-phenylpropionic acid transporter
VALAFAVGSLRWLLTGLLSDPLALVLVQASHGVAFGLFWLGAVQVMRERAPDEIRASAQSLVGTSAYCVGPLLNAVQVGLLLESQGTSAIFVLCAIWSALASALVLLAIRREAAHVSRGAASRGARSTEAAP